jgi:hypothetical protein
MHARLDRGGVRLLTRTGLDWTHKYPAIAQAVSSLRAGQAYLDGELCGVRADGITSFSMIQMASDAGNAAGLVFFLFDLLLSRWGGFLFLSVRSSLSRWGGFLSPAADRTQGAARRVAGGYGLTPALLRSPDRLWPRVSSEGLRDVARGDRLEARRCAVRARQPRALHVIQHTDRNLSSSHTRGTRFTANAFASTAASDVPAVRSFTSRCSQVFPEKFQHGCAMLRCAQRYRRGRPGLQSRP